VHGDPQFVNAAAVKPEFHYADFPAWGSFGEVGVMEFGLYRARR